jgi:hypothetical protein
MGSASIHRVGSPERVQFTVAELLGRCGGEERGAARSGRVQPVPAGWPSGAGSVRRRLASAAGTVVVAGTFAVGAVLTGPATHGGGPLGAETAGAGHPEAEPKLGPPRAPSAPRREVTPVARVVPVRPVARTPVRRPAPRVAPLEMPRTRDIRADETVRAPAGSALSRLTPAIGPLDAPLEAPLDAPVGALSSLLGGLGR